MVIQLLVEYHNWIVVFENPISPRFGERASFFENREPLGLVWLPWVDRPGAPSRFAANENLLGLAEFFSRMGVRAALGRGQRAPRWGRPGVCWGWAWHG